MLEIVPATIDDLDAIWQLYVDVCAQQERDEYTPGWTIGIYPTHDDVAQFIAAGELHKAVLNGQLVGAMVLVGHDDEEYTEVPWPTQAAPDEVAAIHLLCVHPKVRGQQLGLALTQVAVGLARWAGKKAVHLDVYPGNRAASRIYEKAGFVYVCNFDFTYEDVGTLSFEMYEYPIVEGASTCACSGK